MSKLKGKVAVVTGASKGIGAGIAKSLAAEGASVVVNYSTSKEGADRVVADITAKGGKALAVQGNMGKAADVKRLFNETREFFGQVDVLVNNAGVFKFHPLQEITEDEYYRQFDTNVLGPILATREALQHFNSGGGSIINISSVISTGPLPHSVVYSGTKGALDTITKAMAVELAPRKIRVNAIAPGGTETEGVHAAGVMGGELEQMMIAQTPLGRMGKPEDIAKVAVFLASDDSGWLTGERIAASGGLR